VACALIAVSLQNRTARKLMRLQLSVQMAGQYEAETMQRIRSRLARRLLTEARPNTIDDSVLLFLENVSHLARRNLLDDVFVYNYFGYDVPYYWAALKTHVGDLRIELKDPSMYEELERMAAHLARAQSSPLRTTVPALDMSERTVRQFLRLEVARTGGVDPLSDNRLRVNRRKRSRHCGPK